MLLVVSTIDLNNDAKLGVYSLTDVKLSTERANEYPVGGIFSGTGKSSGLIKTNINNIDYLVVKKLPLETRPSTSFQVQECF